MTRITIFSLAALVLLSIGGGSLFIPWGAADTRLAAPLSFIPMQLAGWSGSYAAPPDPLHVDPTVPDQLVRSYRRDTDVVWIAVD